MYIPSISYTHTLNKVCKMMIHGTVDLRIGNLSPVWYVCMYVCMYVHMCVCAYVKLGS